MLKIFIEIVEKWNNFFKGFLKGNDTNYKI